MTQTSTRLRSLRDDITFIGPSLALFAVIVVASFALSIYYSFTDWDVTTGSAPWVGWDNYTTVFEDPRVASSAWFTARFAVITTAAANVIGLGLALLVTQPIRLKRLYRVVFFLPNVIGGIILGFIFRFIFGTALGTIGDATGIGLFSLPWLGEPGTAFWATVIVFVWKSAGYLMVIYIAAIVSVDQTYIESARVEGAGWLRITRHITLPLIAPAFTIGIFLMLSIASKLFDVIFALTNGGPFGTTEAFALNIYNEAFVYNNEGIASAKAVLFFVVVGALTLSQVALTQRREVER